MDFLSYFLQHPVSSIGYIIASIGFILTIIGTYKDYKKLKKISNTQKTVLFIVLGCLISICGSLLPDDDPASLIICVLGLVFALFVPVFMIFRAACKTSKK